MSLKKNIRRNIISLYEGIKPGENPDHKYYAFDWDDNVMNMPTQIMVIDDKGNEVGISTEDFAHYRHILGKEPFVHNGKKIVGYAELPFRYFRQAGEAKFLEDVMTASFGPSWEDFVECINGGSIFAIITARGHNPNVLKKAVHKLIMNDIGGIDQNKLVQSLKDYREIAGEEILDDDTMIDEYLDLCRFHPVSFGTGAEKNPEDEKVKALRDFIGYVKKISQLIGGRTLFKNDVKNNFVIPKIGFSDDDEKNIERVKEFLKKEYGVESPVQTYLTKKGIKTKY